MPLRVPRLVKAAAVIGLASVPIVTVSLPASASTVRHREWWLGALHVTRAWRTGKGAGVTVAVLADGVAAGQADLTGSVTTGPSFLTLVKNRRSATARHGLVGTALASLIVGHGHGKRDAEGVVGIAPQARVLSVTVTLSPGDPRWSDKAVTSRLPAAIAAGIRYAVLHGATVIVLPADPGMPGSSGHRATPAAAGGSAAERAAISQAIRRNVVLVAPAGDNGQGADAPSYPAAYPGVIAVGAFGRTFVKSPYSSRRRYVTLTAAGQGMVVATPAGYRTMSSTSAASAIVGGIAALVRSQFPDLTAAQVSRAMTLGTAFRPRGGMSDGSGHGTADALGALREAATMSPPHAQRAMLGALPRVRPATPVVPTRESVIARELVRDAGISGGMLAALLVPITWYGAVARRRERKAALQAERERLDRVRPGRQDMPADPLLEFFGPQHARPSDWPAGSPSAGTPRFQPAAGMSGRPAIPLFGQGTGQVLPVATTTMPNVLAAPTSAAPASAGPAGPAPAADLPLPTRRPRKVRDDRVPAPRADDPATRPPDSAFGAAPGTYLKSSVRHRQVTGTPPWEPAPEPTSELPWPVLPAPPGIAQPVAESTPAAKEPPESFWDEAPPRPSPAPVWDEIAPPPPPSPRGLFDPARPPADDTRADSGDPPDYRWNPVPSDDGPGEAAADWAERPVDDGWPARSAHSRPPRPPGGEWD